MQLNEIIEIICQIKNNLPRKFQNRGIKLWIAISIFILIFSMTLMNWTISPNNNVKSKPKTAPIKKLSDTTIDMFDDVKKLTANTTVGGSNGLDCRKIASMIQRSPAFEFHGCQIATGLRKFKEEILVANLLIQKMYSKGSRVYETFDEKIEEMIKRFKCQKKGKTEYFKEKINFIIIKIKEFKQSIEEAQNFIQEVEKTRDITAGYIHDGMREAENFITTELDYLGHTIDKDFAIKEIIIINNFLDRLNNIADKLDKMRKLLMAYEDNLSDMSKELDNNNREDDDEDGIFEVKNEDLVHLQNAIVRVKDSHRKFIQKSLITC
ncbi:hypothetical protein RhiirA5_393413 [Rhizophagus irregularis]|uniref:Uncharacterized protein n=1 Tax=Rhizophagus irregularis TaxID=588596 RepID=A0A2I1E7Z9_9GLOM|nr:hypothetical protein RhiirA5_393413 [Rhizophagus irregularis]PKC75504.1 hypothetical protein RhiirA1_436218 [Rhizophagus irregularis]PKY18265.1 hypothetical protein RhiirB3_468460 [Rhizophagus irregularis]CAB4486464.1 unnamed protein product [Rhizophagus irregularis]CAB5122281.1 unnamed protein product [Rhizophagus irregularis]